MDFELRFPSRYHLWAELSRGRMGRVFIPADLSKPGPAIGDTVNLRLTLPELLLPVSLSAEVIGRRRGSKRFSQGFYLCLSERQLDKCRQLLGLTGERREHHGRRNRRVPAALTIRLTSPATSEECQSRNISESGLLADVPVALTNGQIVEAVLCLDEGTDIPFRAEVVWVSEESASAGLHFIDLCEDSRRALRACVSRSWSKFRREQTGSPIVVADDDPAIQHLIAKALQASGYTVYKASTGTEAMGLVRELQPDMVVLDILMPSIDGMDICKAMRADEELADIPVLFVSALEPADLHRVAEEAGATDYLAKPVHLSELLDMVGLYLRQRQADLARVMAEAG